METSAVSPSQHYFSQLDFLSLAGLDGVPSHESPASTPGSAPASARAQAAYARYDPAPGAGEFDLDPGGKHPYTRSRLSLPVSSGGAENDAEPLDDPSPISLEPSRSSSGRGQRRGETMDVDPGSAGSRSREEEQHQHQHQHHDYEQYSAEMAGAAYDAIQAGILQHQLESIHMQSPFVGASNPQSPYGAMAQMFLTSPPSYSGSGSLGDSSQGGLDRGMQRKIGGVMNTHGVLTPGPSGNIVPEMRMDLMSPMQLEMMARGEMIEGMENFQAMPLLSPALSQHTPSSYASPVAQVAFNASPSGSRETNQHALEQLQKQQRQFQEQLALLQEQQRQLQATAAAVAAAQGSPYLSGQQSGGRPAITPGAGSATMSTPSPGSYFSPLTSPALEPAVSRSAHLRAAAQHLSPAMHAQAQRTPHPLSALSSPALNPVGSSGGAQQTLSPALGPQNGTDIADPDYLNALQGILDGSSSGEAYQGSPVIGPSPSGTGPHRGSLPAKSRPSPMMKPTNHRSHIRQSSGSVPTSPMAFTKISQSGYLPPAAIDQRGVTQAQQQMAQAGSNSTASTPSPVDLAQIMPPPPVPSRDRPKMPMTPASLMNLGKEVEVDMEASSSAPPVRAAAKKATNAIAPQPKRGSRLVPASGSAAAKRALAIRPPGGVGVRAATKAAAAAAEPETRRTSHKAAEQKRRDSLKAGFDELRLLLPPINTEALDPESGEPIPGSSAPRLLPKSSLVPDDNPNRGVSKVALLKFSNEYIVRLHGKVQKRDGYIDKLRDEVRRLRLGSDEEVRGDEGEDLLDMDMLDGEESDLDEEEEMDLDDKKKSTKSPHLGPRRKGKRRD